MTEGLQPTEEYDGGLRVKLLDDDAGIREIPCSSYTDAIAVVKDRRYDVTAAKIIDRDGEVVFTSAEMDIDVWESIWRREKRREALNVEERACPYDSLSCFPDDLCVRCEIDTLQNTVSRD
ncbi:MAG: hypothetical protein R6U01_12450 [Halorubrum sp.]|uniref:hypothetical protein n=1 Tax=Halorubrum sp. TaxID=1879286 RepID=UPI0039711116